MTHDGFCPALVVTLATILAVPCACAEDGAMAGKSRTGREIVLEATVPAPPETLFRLWTTDEGIREFFAPASHVVAEPGGAYTIIFDPRNDPTGEKIGTNGCRILRFEPSRVLSFEWKGTPAMVEMNRRPFPTWVDVTFDSISVPTGYTRVRLAHYGFGQGGAWDQAFAFFSGEHGWPTVMQRLQGLLEKK